MNEMNVTSAQYLTDLISGNNCAIKATIDSKVINIPLAPGNRHYDEIMRQVAAGTLTIADAD
jgi:hypothetical protein